MAERQAVSDLLKSESAKLKKFSGENLRKSIEEAEDKLNIFWSGKMDRLSAAHKVKVEKMEKDFKDKLRGLKEDAKQELHAQIEFTAKATRVAMEADFAAQMDNAKRSFESEQRALRALLDSEAAKTKKMISTYESRINALEIAEAAAKSKADGYESEIAALKAQSASALAHGWMNLSLAAGTSSTVASTVAS